MHVHGIRKKREPPFGRTCGLETTTQRVTVATTGVPGDYCFRRRGHTYIYIYVPYRSDYVTGQSNSNNIALLQRATQQEERRQKMFRDHLAKAIRLLIGFQSMTLRAARYPFQKQLPRRDHCTEKTSYHFTLHVRPSVRLYGTGAGTGTER